MLIVAAMALGGPAMLLYGKMHAPQAIAADALGRQLKALYVQPGDVTADGVDVGAGIKQGRDNHVAAAAGKTVEIRYGHVGSSCLGAQLTPRPRV
jgi:hypothetical protein